MRQIFIVLIMLSSITELSTKVNAQQNNDMNQTDRIIFSSVTIGAIELFSFNIGYQINDEFSLAIKNQVIASGDGWILPAVSLGVGLTGSYYFSGRIFNSVKLSAVSLYRTSYQFEPKEFVKGFSLECTLNKEKIFSQLFRFYYELGLAYCKVKNKDDLFAPSVKVGVIYNF